MKWKLSLMISLFLLLAFGTFSNLEALDIIVKNGEDRIALVGDTISLLLDQNTALQTISDPVAFKITKTGYYQIELGEFSATISVTQFPEDVEFLLDDFVSSENFLASLPFYAAAAIPVIYPDGPNYLITTSDDDWEISSEEERVLKVGDLIYVYLPQTRSALTYYELEDDCFEVVWAAEKDFIDHSVFLRAIKAGESSVLTRYEHWQRPVSISEYLFLIKE